MKLYLSSEFIDVDTVANNIGQLFLIESCSHLYYFTDIGVSFATLKNNLLDNSKRKKSEKFTLEGTSFYTSAKQSKYIPELRVKICAVQILNIEQVKYIKVYSEKKSFTIPADEVLWEDWEESIKDICHEYVPQQTSSQNTGIPDVLASDLSCTSVRTKQLLQLELLREYVNKNEDPSTETITEVNLGDCGPSLYLRQINEEHVKNLMNAYEKKELLPEELTITGIFVGKQFRIDDGQHRTCAIKKLNVLAKEKGDSFYAKKLRARVLKESQRIVRGIQDVQAGLPFTLLEKYDQLVKLWAQGVVEHEELKALPIRQLSSVFTNFVDTKQFSNSLIHLSLFNDTCVRDLIEKLSNDGFKGKMSKETVLKSISSAFRTNHMSAKTKCSEVVKKLPSLATLKEEFQDVAPDPETVLIRRGYTQTEIRDILSSLPASKETFRKIKLIANKKKSSVGNFIKKVKQFNSKSSTSYTVYESDSCYDVYYIQEKGISTLRQRISRTEPFITMFQPCSSMNSILAAFGDIDASSLVFYMDTKAVCQKKKITVSVVPIVLIYWENGQMSTAKVLEKLILDARNNEGISNYLDGEALAMLLREMGFQSILFSVDDTYRDVVQCFVPLFQEVCFYEMSPISAKRTGMTKQIDMDISEEDVFEIIE